MEQDPRKKVPEPEEDAEDAGPARTAARGRARSENAAEARAEARDAAVDKEKDAEEAKAGVSGKNAIERIYFVFVWLSVRYSSHWRSK